MSGPGYVMSCFPIRAPAVKARLLQGAAGVAWGQSCWGHPAARVAYSGREPSPGPSRGVQMDFGGFSRGHAAWLMRRRPRTVAVSRVRTGAWHVTDLVALW